MLTSLIIRIYHIGFMVVSPATADTLTSPLRSTKAHLRPPATFVPSKNPPPPYIENLKEAKNVLYAFEASENNLDKVKEAFSRFLDLSDVLTTRPYEILTVLREKVQNLTFPQQQLTWFQRIRNIFFTVHDPAKSLEKERKEISCQLLFLGERMRTEERVRALFREEEMLPQQLTDKVREIYTSQECPYADLCPTFLDGLSEKEKEAVRFPLFQKDQISLLCDKYPKIAEELLKNETLLKDFTRFCLRCRLSVDIFVQFHHETSLLMAHFVDYRLACNPYLLKIEAGHLQLKIDGQFHSIEGENNKKQDVFLANSLDTTRTQSLRLSIAEVFQEIKDKRAEYTKVEIVPEEGVISWDSGLLGCHCIQENGSYGFQQIDLRDSNWIHQLPAKIVSKENLAEEFPYWKISEGCFQGGNKHAFVFAESQEKPNLNLLDTHGFLYLVFPHIDKRGQEIKGQYKVIPIGFQAVDMPTSRAAQQKGWVYKYFGFLGSFVKILHFLGFIENTVPGLVHSPDDSFYATKRARAGLCVPLSSNQFTKILERIRENIFDREHPQQAAPFHVLGRNCAFQVNHFAAPLFEDFYHSIAKMANELDLDLEKIPSLAQFISKLLEQQPTLSKEALIEEILKQHSDFYIDKEALALIDDMIDRLFNLKEGDKILHLIQSCLRLSNQLAISLEDKIECEWDAVTKDAMCRKMFSDQNAKAWLKEIIRKTLEIRDLYKLPFHDCSLSYAVIGPLFEFIKNRCETLRNFLFRLAFFLLGKTRIYQRETKEGGTVAYSASANRAHNEELLLFLPAQLYQSIRSLPQKQKVLGKLVTNLHSMS